MISDVQEPSECRLAQADPRPGPAELWQRYQAAGPGDASEEELLKRHLPLVKTVVGRLAMTLPPQADARDLHSAGVIGLLNALRQFNPARGVPFEHYARMRIRGAVLDEVRRMDWFPRAVHRKARQMQSVLSQLEQQLGRMPDDAEMAEALGISPAQYEQWLDEIRPATFLSLDAPADASGLEEDLLRHELVSEATEEDPLSRVTRKERARLIAERIHQLPDLQKKVLALHYFEDMRLKEIALILNYSEAHICQTHARAILAIRAYVEQRESGAISPGKQP